MRFLIFPAFYLIAALAGTPVWAAISSEPLKIDISKASGEIGFHAIGSPSALKINGKSKSDGEITKGTIEIKNTEATGAVTFSLDKLETGIKLRDKHMKNKYLQVSQFPSATLNITQLKLPESFYKNDEVTLDDLPMTGLFKVHGVEKQIKGAVSLVRKGKSIKLKAQFPISLSEHNIDIPSFMGITVAKEVTVYTDLEAHLE